MAIQRSSAARCLSWRTGKSTLVEAIAVAAGFNPEGGSQNFRFATRASESSLGDSLILTWGVAKPRTGFFLRAESYYNVASEIERLDREGTGPPLLPAYGGVSPHERSHGESFVDLVVHRFGPQAFTCWTSRKPRCQCTAAWRCRCD